MCDADGAGSCGRWWRWIREIGTRDALGHGAAVDIGKNRTALSAELYQVILSHALARGQVERNISIVPTLPAGPVVPALRALVLIPGFGNQENAGPGKVS